MIFYVDLALFIGHSEYFVQNEQTGGGHPPAQCLKRFLDYCQHKLLTYLSELPNQKDFKFIYFRIDLLLSSQKKFGAFMRFLEY